MAGQLIKSEDEIEFFRPRVTRISSAETVIGDTLTIYGRYFGYRKGLNWVFVNGEPVSPFTESTDSVKFKMPITTDPIDIFLAISAGFVSNTKTINYAEPKLNKLNPDQGKSGKVIRLEGNNFGYDKSAMIVYFNNLRAIILRQSNNHLDVVVPTRLTNPIKVKVVVNDKITNEKSFTLVF